LSKINFQIQEGMRSVNENTVPSTECEPKCCPQTSNRHFRSSCERCSKALSTAMWM